MDINNPTKKIIDIHILFGGISYFLFSLLPKSFFRIERIDSAIKFRALPHVFSKETTFFYDKNRILIENKTTWNDDSPYRIAFDVPKIHFHHLIYYSIPFERDSFSCDICVAQAGVHGFFLCSETVCAADNQEPDERENCDFGICTNCFYNYFLELNCQKIDAELNLLVEGKKSILKTCELEFQLSQNALVMDMIKKYLKVNRNGALPLPEPWNKYVKIKAELEEKKTDIPATEQLFELKKAEDILPEAFTLPILEPALSTDPLPLVESDEEVELESDDKESSLMKNISRMRVSNPTPSDPLLQKEKPVKK